MAATLHFRITHGASGDPTVETTDAADLNLLSADLGGGQTPAAYPIISPEEGTRYSFERWFNIFVVDMNGSSRIQNLRIHADTATPSTGCTIKYGQSASYVTPKDNETVSTIADANIPTELPSENLYIGGSASGYMDDDEDTSDYGILQLHVIQTATEGPEYPVDITLTFDEIA